MPNLELITKNEGSIIWSNSSKTGATAQKLDLNKGGLQIQVQRQLAEILKDDATYDHAKKIMDPATSVVLRALYRDRLASLLDTTTSGFEAKDAGKTTAIGTLAHLAAYGASPSYDSITVPNLSLMGYTISSAPDGNAIELNLAGVGEPTNGTTTIASTPITPTNTEVVNLATSYLRWKSNGSTGTPAATTLGLIQSFRLAVQIPKILVRKTDGTFSHAKLLGAYRWSVDCTILYQDGVTSLIYDTSNGFSNLTSNKTVPTGTLAVESLFNTGSVGESIQLANTRLLNYSFGQGEQGNTLSLSFAGIGTTAQPTPLFAAATLA